MKNRLLLITVVLLGIAILSTGCSAIFHTVPAGKIVEKTYDFKDFTNLEISGEMQYVISQSGGYGVVLTCHENMIEHLDVYQSGNTVHIGVKFGTYSDTALRVEIGMPQLNKLAVSGSCEGSATGFDPASDLAINVAGDSKLNASLIAGKTALDISGDSEVTGTLTATGTQIKVAGASRLNMNIKTGQTGVDISGESEVTGTLEALDSRITMSGDSNCILTGSAGNTTIDLSGSSQMNSPGLLLQNAKVNLTGASYAYIYTNGALSFDLSDASTLDFKGNPMMGKTNISPGSNLKHK